MNIYRRSVLFVLFIMQLGALGALVWIMHSGGGVIRLFGRKVLSAHDPYRTLAILLLSFAFSAVLLDKRPGKIKAYYGFIRNNFLLIVLICVAAVQRLLLMKNSTNPFGYVWDFYHNPMLLYYEKGYLPESFDCWECYHPPLFTIIGKHIYSLGMMISNNDSVFSLKFVSFFSVLVSVVFIVFAFKTLQLYRSNKTHNRLLLAILLALPLLFINTYAIESDLLCSTFMVMAFYCFSKYHISDDRKSTYHVVCMALFSGLAASTKYSGLIVVVALGFLIFIEWVTGKDKKAVALHLVLFCMISFSSGSWKYLDNYAKYNQFITGNQAWRHLTENTEKKYFWDSYEFTSFRFGELVDLMRPDAEGGKLKNFPAYNTSVFTSLHGQTWTDVSMFSNPTRHGFIQGIYPFKDIPVVLIIVTILLGLFPLLLAFLGLFHMFGTLRLHYPVLVFSLIGIAVYARWFLGYHEWMLKTKYLLFLIPCYLIFVSHGLGLLRGKSRHLERFSIVTLTALTITSNLYLFYFAIR